MLNLQAKHLTLESRHSVKVTIDRVQTAITNHRAMVMHYRIDQQAIATASGHAIRPVECITYQNPQLVEIILKIDPEFSDVLPLKIVAWEDADGRTWVRAPDIDVLHTGYRVPMKDIAEAYSIQSTWLHEATR